MLELERVERDTVRNVLTREEAEVAAGRLVALQLQGRLELEWVTE